MFTSGNANSTHSIPRRADFCWIGNAGDSSGDTVPQRALRYWYTGAMSSSFRLIAFSAFISLSQGAFAESLGSEEPQDRFLGYEERLRQERYETALAREEAEQARLEGLRHRYASQEGSYDTYSRQSEREREQSIRDNDISSINQAASTVANIIRQAQILSGTRYGW